MNKNYLIGIVVVIIIVGILIGIKLGGNITGNLSSDVGDENTPNVSEENGVTTIPIEPTLTKAPTPTFAPLTDIVKSVSADAIIISGKGGDMTVPKNSSMVKVFVKKGDQVSPGSFDDITVGSEVTLKIITPGKEAELTVNQ